MGSLRFILAFAVLDVHANITTRPLIGGETAVQMFFLISGFYMAMVLHETYLPGHAGLRDFWASRASRIFPAYYAVLFITLLVWMVAPTVTRLHPPAEIGLARASLMGLSQLSLLGLDAYYWLAFGDHGQVVFTANFWNEAAPVWRTLLLPQSWTLSLELYFYLLAPFLVRRSLTSMLVIIALSVAARVVVSAWGFSGDPWSYRCFVFEIVFFMSGVVAYRLAKSDMTPKTRLAVQACVGLMLIVAAFMSRNGASGRLRLMEAVLTAALFFGLAALFQASRSNRFDRLLGELSYPLYLCHVLVVYLVGSNPLAVTVAAIGGAALLYVGIDRPIDAWRHRRFPGARRQSSLTLQSTA